MSQFGQQMLDTEQGIGESFRMEVAAYNPDGIQSDGWIQVEIDEGKKKME